MIDIDKILDTAKKKNASDVHLICGIKNNERTYSM